MSVEKHKKLLELLYSRTREGKVNWSDTVDRGSYLASFENYSVEISQQRNPDNPEEADVVISIRNSSGDVIESFVDTDIGTQIDEQQLRREFYQRASALYSMARRAALGTDKALDAIIGELDDMIPF
jgi:hypothetical protein